MSRLRSALAAVFLVAAIGPAHADESSWDECVGCLERDWIVAEPGIGPGVGSLARIELGTTSFVIDDPSGGRASSAGYGRARVQIALGSTLAVRGSGTAQLLGTSPEPFPLVGGARVGGALAVGLTQQVYVIKHGKIPLAVTLDGELASGPAVRAGLGMRTLSDDARRLTVAAGAASAWDFYHGSVRAHARYLRAPYRAGMRDDAVEVGAGASTRINWAGDFWGGSWPLEAWIDYRHRRGIDNAVAREHEVRGGFDYTPERWLSRVGVQLAGSDDRLDDGRVARGLSLLVSVQLGPR